MVYLLIFMSGLAGLIYEILWMKQLGLLFGNTSHAAAATLAAFFAGLSAGSWFWGRRVARMRNPLRLYAWLEVGIALAALIYFFVLRAFYMVYPMVYQRVDAAGVLLGVKFVLSLILIFPPAFFMGGTIPAMGQHLVRNRSTFGSTSALVYGMNTLGAAVGACLAGFFMPLWLGFRFSCISAMTVTTAVATMAFLLSRKNMDEFSVGNADQRDAPETAEPGALMWRVIVLCVCFLSGFGVLALEVLWTRLFAQVLENSVYTFAAILVIVLVCLAAGSFISSRLARMSVPPVSMLAALILFSGIAVSTTPFVFMKLTHSLQILALRASWPRYIGMIFKNGFLAIGPPALVLGIVFPYLMKVEERMVISPGKSLGLLSAINTIGAILGSLLCGFVFLGSLGMWRTMQIIAAVYLLVSVAIPFSSDIKDILFKSVGLIFLVLLLTALNPSGLPTNSVDPHRMEERILKTWEGSDCIVAVASNKITGLSIKINSHYGLGATGAATMERWQADIPLMAYPDTKSIFFLGIGTGITAGSALDPMFPNVKRVVACELVPEVVEAAKEFVTKVYGEDLTGGLFTDPRATVLVEDGRHYLMASGERFDMVNGDLFVPFRSGAGSLYSKNHFESVKKSLNPGGVFVQWLPLYQVTQTEFMTIARTMLEVFDQVSLWRNNFQPGDEVVALVGHKGGLPVPACAVDSIADRKRAVAGKDHRDLDFLQLPFDQDTILFFYCGNITKSAPLFADYPVNTDDKPMIEYMAPRTYRGDTGASTPWFVGPRIIRLIEELQKHCPPDSDPLLVKRSPADRRLPVAGMAFHRARLWELIRASASTRQEWEEYDARCRDSWQKFVEEWTNANPE